MCSHKNTKVSADFFFFFMFQARLNSIAKQQSYEDSKTDYFNQLQKTNEAQKQHYFELMPKVFQVNR